MTLECAKCGSRNIVDDYDHVNRIPEKKCLSCGYRLYPHYPPRTGKTTSLPDICECERCEEEFEATVENARFCPGCLKTVQLESLAPRARSGGLPHVAKQKRRIKTQKEDIMHKFCSNCTERNPNTTKIAVIDGLCSTCFREKNGLTVKEAFTQRRMVRKGLSALPLPKKSHDVCSNCFQKDPNSIKYPVLAGLCSTCFKEINGMSVRDAKRKRKAQLEDLPSALLLAKTSIAPQEVTLERVVQPDTAQAITLTVDFSPYPDLYEKLCDTATREFRQPASQILAFVERGLEGNS